jgi:hypothetical protein
MKTVKGQVYHFLGLNGTKVGMITLLILGSGACLLGAAS